MSANLLSCPKCGREGLDVHDFESMIALAPHLALFALHCPACATWVSTVCPIPDDLVEEVEFAAIEIGAGMGKAN